MLEARKTTVNSPTTRTPRRIETPSPGRRFIQFLLSQEIDRPIVETLGDLMGRYCATVRPRLASLIFNILWLITMSTNVHCHNKHSHFGRNVRRAHCLAAGTMPAGSQRDNIPACSAALDFQVCQGRRSAAVEIKQIDQCRKFRGSV